MEKTIGGKSQQENNQISAPNSAKDVGPKSKINLAIQSKTLTTASSPNAKSKIPTRERSSVSSRAPNLSPPQEKRFSLRKKSKTNIDISRPESKHTQPAVFTPKLNNSSKFSINSSNASSPRTANSKYRIGEVPSYLKKGSEKNVTEVALNNKKKAFNVLKKKVEDQQTEFLSTYKALHDIQSKYNKATGKEDSIDEIKLISVMLNNVEELLIKKDDGTLKTTTRAVSPLKAAKDSLKLDQIKHKLKTVSSSSFNLCSDFFCSFAKLPNSIDRPTGDGAVYEKEVLQVMKSLESTARGIKEQLNFLKEAINELDEVSSAGLSVDPLLTKAYEDKIAQLNKQLEGKMPDVSQSSKITEMKQIESHAMKELKAQLTDNQVILSEKEQEIMKLKSNVKKLDEEKKDIEKQIQSISNELAAKNTAVKKLENEVEVYRSRSKQNEAIMDEVRKQKDSILEHVRHEQDAIKQYEKEHDARLRLENDLLEREKLVNKLKDDLDKQKMSAALAGGDRSISETEYWGEVQNLRVKLDKTVMEKACIEKERNDLKKTLDDRKQENDKIELIKANQEINHLNNTNNCLRDTIAKLEQSVTKKQSAINDLEQKIANGLYLTNTSKDLQNELSMLHESESEKKREIENLKCELSKARIEIKQQEETIYMHQRLLRIRSELINSLQEKEASNRCRMDDLYSEITKKTSLVNQMNNEISAKAEELQNLFSTLGTKQMELTRQEHIIKMLEENNERSQRLRVKQEEKIARLESENSELKHVLKIANLKSAKL